MDLVEIGRDYIVPIVVVAGFSLAFHQWWRSRPRISIEFTYTDVYEFPEDPRANFRVDSYEIVVKNLGKESITIDAAGFNWKKREYITKYYHDLISDDSESFPVKLDSGSTKSIAFSRREISQEILNSGLSGTIKVKGFIKDGYGKYYKSSPVEIIVEKEKL